MLRLGRQRSPLLEHFGIQTAAWGADRARRWRSSRQQSLALRDLAGATRLDRMLWLNIGLDVGYVLVGLTLVVLGWRAVRRLGLVGAGIGGRPAGRRAGTARSRARGPDLALMRCAPTRPRCADSRWLGMFQIVRPMNSRLPATRCRSAATPTESITRSPSRRSITIDRCGRARAFPTSRIRRTSRSSSRATDRTR